MVYVSLPESGAAEGTRTPDPIITNDVLYHLSYSGFLGSDLALLVLLLCRETRGFASHSRGRPLFASGGLRQLRRNGVLLSATPYYGAADYTTRPLSALN